MIKLLEKCDIIRIYSVGVWNARWLVGCRDLLGIRIYSVGVWNHLTKSREQKIKKLEFTPLEFETWIVFFQCRITLIRIYSVGVWNFLPFRLLEPIIWLEFTPLEFETKLCSRSSPRLFALEFTPLEFETGHIVIIKYEVAIRIYSVGVWNANMCNNSLNKTKLEFTPLEFETVMLALPYCLKT